MRTDRGIGRWCRRRVAGRLVVLAGAAAAVVAVTTMVGAWRTQATVDGRARDRLVATDVIERSARRFDAAVARVEAYAFSGGVTDDPGVDPGAGVAADVDAVASLVDADLADGHLADDGSVLDGATLREGFDAWRTAAADLVAAVRAGRPVAAEDVRLPSTDPFAGVAATLEAQRRAYLRAAVDDAAQAADAARAAVRAGATGLASAGVLAVALARRRRSGPRDRNIA